MWLGVFGCLLQTGQEDLRLGLAECINTLLYVADDEDVVGSAYFIEDGLLDGVDILVFIDKDISELFAEVSSLSI